MMEWPLLPQFVNLSKRQTKGLQNALVRPEGGVRA
jgi:hypothetical protein